MWAVGCFHPWRGIFQQDCPLGTAHPPKTQKSAPSMFRTAPVPAGDGNGKELSFVGYKTWLSFWRWLFIDLAEFLTQPLPYNCWPIREELKCGWTEVESPKHFNENTHGVYMASIRDAPRFQIGWIFGKVPRGGGHFQSKNLYCKIWTFKQGFFIMKMIQRGHFRVCFSTNYHVELLYYMHLYIRTIHCVIFRKFIRLGEGRLPLSSSP